MPFNFNLQKANKLSSNEQKQQQEQACKTKFAFHINTQTDQKLISYVKKNGLCTFRQSGGNLYSGIWENDVLNGYGIIRFYNGQQYKGILNNSMMEGYGQLSNIKDGTSYEGEFSRDIITCFGKQVLQNGEVYEGEFYRGKKHGFGIAKYANGDTYLGLFDENQKSNFGTLIHENDKYIGQFRNDQQYGIGAIYNNGGDVYIGYWKSDVICSVQSRLQEQNGISISEYMDVKAYGIGYQCTAEGHKEKAVYQNNRAIRLILQINNNGTIHKQIGNQEESGYYVYSGQIKNQKMHGFGTKKYDNDFEQIGYFLDNTANGLCVQQKSGDSSYFGLMLNDERHGAGSISWKSGAQYIGTFKNDSESGYGQYIWPDNSKYIGELKNGDRSGFGQVEWISGTKYTGQLSKDEFNGFGIIEYGLGGLYDGGRYIGEFVSGRRSGYGILSLMNTTYCGCWQKDKANGYGTLIFANCQVYKQYFANNSTIGVNKDLIFVNGNNYTGQYSQDHALLGYGQLTFANGMIQLGYFNKDKLDNYCEILWPNGDRYIGEIRDEKRDGFGRIVYNNGNTYTGEWKDNKANGFGVLNSVILNCKYTGEFFNDSIKADNKLLFTNGDVFDGEIDSKHNLLSGTKIYASGNRMTNSKRNEKNESEVIFQWKNGEMYKGLLTRCIHGTGEFTYQSGKVMKCAWDGKYHLKIFSGGIGSAVLEQRLYDERWEHYVAE